MNHTGEISSPRHHKRHDGQRSTGSGSANASNRSNTNKYIRDCACGRGLACVGMTQAFRLLGDPRCYYVELPRFRKDPPAYKYTFRNNLRAAYLRHLRSQNPNLDLGVLEQSQERRYVALHHFHPAVVKAFYDNPLTSGAARKHKVPISITEHELHELNMDIHQEDRILSVTGVPTGGYYFCPSYPQENVHEDLKHLIKRERAMREEKARQNEKTKETIVPEKIEISKSIVPQPTAAESDLVSSLQVLQDSKSPKVTDDLDQLGDYGVLVAEGAETIPTKSNEGETEKNQTGLAEEDCSTEIRRDRARLYTEEFDKREDQEVEAEFRTVVPEKNTSEFESLWAFEDCGVNKRRLADEDDKTLEDEEMEENLCKSSDGVVRPDSFGTNEVGETSVENMVFQSPALKARGPGRETDHPWETPKYRRRHLEHHEMPKRTGSVPAHFIDPTITLLEPGAKAKEDGEDDNTRSAQTHEKPLASIVQVVKAASIDTAKAAQKSASTISAAALLPMKSIDETEETSNESSLHLLTSSKSDKQGTDPPGWSGTRNDTVEASPSRVHGIILENKSLDDNRSQESDDSFSNGAIALKHHFPGADPTIRIQVHNELIAWESKRRTDMAEVLGFQNEMWQAMRSLLQEGLEDVDLAERFVAGFAKAGVIFSDSIQAVCDDKLLDDSGKTVSSSFLQNRLYKKRNTQAQEYSIDVSQDPSTESGQSALLNAIVEAQLEMANTFRDCSLHVQNEILPEFSELRDEIVAEAKELKPLGDSIIGEMRRSEIELKNIWDVFDAMVTGDLMEYSVHGSLHGGSQHSGSVHSSFGSGPGSMQGFLAPRGEGDGVKSTFRQLGAVEDGWLVEMYYRSAVAYQKAVFGIAENELMNLCKRITSLEERRFRRLHQILLAFVPRQRRLFAALPETLKGVLNELVGLRIDEDTLQTIIDESIRDRSHDHLKRGASHRSSIMNRSRITKAKDAEEAEVEKIESVFGNPFQSTMVLLSKVVELQSGGIRSMVNTSWKSALVVVTAEGNMHVFTLPEELSGKDYSPFEAFQALSPGMDFDAPAHWLRKQEITKLLTPTTTLSMKHCTFSVPKIHNCHLQVVEEKPLIVAGSNAPGGGNRFIKVMKAAADSQRSRRCTFRLSSAAEMEELVNDLDRTKKFLSSNMRDIEDSQASF